MLHILIADDEYLVRERVKQILPLLKSEIGLVSEAEDGEIALGIIKQKNPQIIILDIDMPFINGLKLTKIIREENLNTQIIILSGYNDFTFAQEAIRQDVIAYLTKPVKTDEMLGALTKACERQRKIAKLQAQEIESDLQILLHQGIISDKINTSLDLKEQEWVHLLVVEGNPTEQQQITTILKSDLETRGYRVYMSDKITSWNTLVCFSETKFLPKLQNILSDYPYSSCAIWYKNPVKTLEELTARYLQIRYARQLRLFYTPIGIIPNKIKFSLPDADCISKNWKLVLAQGSSQTVSNLLAEQIHKIKGYDSGEIFVQYIATLIRVATEYAEEKQLPLPDSILLPIPVISLMEQYSDLNRLISWIESLFNKLLSPQNKKPEVLSISQRVYSIIDSDYTDKNLDLQAIANAACAHPNYVSTKFKEETGKNVMTYLKEVRLTAAKNLIEDAGMDCHDASWLVGFSDQYYFSKCFKKMFGKSPGSLLTNQ